MTTRTPPSLSLDLDTLIRGNTATRPLKGSTNVLTQPIPLPWGNSPSGTCALRRQSSAGSDHSITDGELDDMKGHKAVWDAADMDISRFVLPLCKVLAEAKGDKVEVTDLGITEADDGVATILTFRIAQTQPRSAHGPETGTAVGTASKDSTPSRLHAASSRLSGKQASQTKRSTRAKMPKSSRQATTRSDSQQKAAPAPKPISYTAQWAKSEPYLRGTSALPTRIAWDVQLQSALAEWEQGVGRTLLKGLLDPLVPELLARSSDRKISWTTAAPTAASTFLPVDQVARPKCYLPYVAPMPTVAGYGSYLNLDNDTVNEPERAPIYRHTVSIRDAPDEQDDHCREGVCRKTWVLEMKSENLDELSSANTPLPTGTAHHREEGFFGGEDAVDTMLM